MGLRSTVFGLIFNTKLVTKSSTGFRIPEQLSLNETNNDNQRKPSMTRFQLSTTLKISALCLACVAAYVHAHEFYTAAFKIIHPWAEATTPGTAIAPVYLTFEEVTGSDKLIAARSDIAVRVELRSKLANDSTAEVSAILPAIEVTAGSTTELHAGGAHLVMIGLKTPLQWGRSYPLTLIFEKAGAIDTVLSVGSH